MNYITAPIVKKSKLPMKNYTQNLHKKEALFWKRKFMQVLEALYDVEATWAINHWKDYGISDKEMLIIEQEFAKQQKWRGGQKDKVTQNFQHQADELGFNHYSEGIFEGEIDER